MKLLEESRDCSYGDPTSKICSSTCSTRRTPRSTTSTSSAGGTNATPEDLTETCLYNQDDGFELGTWDNEKRQAHIQERVNGDGGDHLSNLDKLQFLRYRYEKGQAVQNYVEKWDVDDDLCELVGQLADITADKTYTRVLGDRDVTC